MLLLMIRKTIITQILLKHFQLNACLKMIQSGQFILLHCMGYNKMWRSCTSVNRQLGQLLHGVSL